MRDRFSPCALITATLLFLAFLPHVGAQEISGWAVTPGTSNIDSALSGGFSAVNTSSNAVPWRVLLEGRDIYGNSLAVPIATGSLDPGLGVTVSANGTTNKSPVPQTFNGTIPNDGTLYNMTGSGYRLNLYTGTNLTVISPGDRKAGTSGFLVDVTPDLAIPPAVQVTKVRATGAAANLTGTAVTSIALANPGQGYDPAKPPTVTFNPPGAVATAVVEPERGSITGFIITSGGNYPVAAPSVSIANTPNYQTQRSGGTLYGYNPSTGQYNYAFNSGDAVRFQTTVRNNLRGDGTRQSRPMRTSAADEFRLRTVLTVDPAYTATAGDDDLLVFDQAWFGDMSVYPQDLTDVRTIKTYTTPAAVPTYGVLAVVGVVPATATASVVDGRVTGFSGVAGGNYDPLNPPPVTIVAAPDDPGTGATAIAAVDPTGAITAITVVSPGIGYAVAPTVVIPPPAYGARYYQPLPDDGFLDIGEEVQVGYDVLLPQRYPGVFYVASKVDALNQVAEPVGFSPGRESPPLDETALVNNNTFISAIGTRVQVLSGPGPGLNIASQVSDSSGAPIIQSDGYSDIASVDESGKYVVFESYARDLAVNQSTAVSAVGASITGVPPLWSQLSTTARDQLIGGQSNGRKQIYRRNTSNRTIDTVSVSSSGAQANEDALNAFVNANGRQVAFESRAANLVNNDTSGSSDIFIRRFDVLRTVRVSVNASGVQGDNSSFSPSLSGSGRFVAFESQATNLDPSNPKLGGNNSQQIFVHDRDVAGTGILDSPGNIRTYLASVSSVGASQATATAVVSGGRLSSITVASGGSGYVQAQPPAVIISGGGGRDASAVAVVNSSGVVTSFTITNAGSGYSSAPAITVAPRATAADGWCNQARISEDGNFLTFVSYSSNLPQTAGGAPLGNTGYQGVVYRISLFQGMPVPSSIQAVSVASSGTLANALSYEPAINGDGSQIVFTSMADNLVADDNNGVADVFVRDFTNNKTVRVSESLERIAIGSISFPSATSGIVPQSPPNNNPNAGDAITLGDGINSVTFTFTLSAPAAVTDVQVGGNASQSRDNLVRAINAASAQGLIGLVALADSPASPDPYYVSASSTPGQALNPGLFLMATRQSAGQASVAGGALTGIAVVSGGSGYDPAAPPLVGLIGGGGTGATAVASVSSAGVVTGFTVTNPGTGYVSAPVVSVAAPLGASQSNVEISGNFTVIQSVDGTNIGQFAGTNQIYILTTGLRYGGSEAEDDAGDFDGVPAGSTMPTIDKSGRVVAFRSTMQTLDVYNRSYTGTNGLLRGELMRMLRNASANVYLRVRDVDGDGSSPLDAPGNVDTKRISVDRFGYATKRLLNVPSAANSHKPFLSASGRYVAFSSDAENNGGLVFGRTNLDPQDTNGYRDVFVHDRDTTAEPPSIVTNNPPDVVLTEPSWLSSRELSVGSVIKINALVTDADEELGLANVSFFVNGLEIPAQSRYGNYFSATYRITAISDSNIIQARALDNSGADNNFTTSEPITFASVPSIPQPTSITLLSLPRGTLPQVGVPIELSARVTLPNSPDLYSDAVVRFYANGVLIGSDPVSTGVNNTTATITWFPSNSGSVVLSAVAGTATYFFATTNPRTWATLASNELPSINVLGVNESPAAGTPDEMVNYIYQTVLSRPPTPTEFTYWLAALSSYAATPASMVLQIVAEGEYTDLQNRLFGYYYRMGVAPEPATYLQRVGFMEEQGLQTAVAAAGYPTVNSQISPYGATEGDAAAAEGIILSPAFAAANPGQQTSNNQAFMTWYFGRSGGQLGPANLLLNAMNAYAATATPPTSAKGYSVAFISALRDANDGLQNAFNYQLKATSLQWLFTGVWTAPTVPAVTTQAQLNAFVANLLLASSGQTTWSWVSANGLTGQSAEAASSPAGDGISNLKKYAFNLSPTTNYSGAAQVITPTGVAGLPLISTVVVDGLEYLQITYIRRINANSVTYQAQFTSDLMALGGWQAASVEPSVTPVDDVWERVVVRDSLPTSAVPARYARVQLTASYWTP